MGGTTELRIFYVPTRGLSGISGREYKGGPRGFFFLCSMFCLAPQFYFIFVAAGGSFCRWESQRPQCMHRIEGVGIRRDPLVASSWKILPCSDFGFRLILLATDLYY